MTTAGGVPWTAYTCAEDACKAVQTEAARNKVTLTARPMNYRDPKGTEWWLVPPKEDSWPAYHRGKLHFEHDKGVLHVGLHVEKGISSEAAKLAGFSRASVMTDDWLWPSFLGDLRRGAVADTLASLSADLDPEYWVYCGAPVEREGAFEDDRENVVLSARSGERRNASKVSRDQLHEVSVARTPEALADALGTPGPFYWVDVFVRAGFRREGAEKDRWDGARLWTDWVRPLLRWVR